MGLATPDTMCQLEKWVCASCGKKANIAILNKDGTVSEDNVFCCWCFAKDFREKMLKALDMGEVLRQ